MNANEYIRKIETKIGFNRNEFVDKSFALYDKNISYLRKRQEELWGAEFKTSYTSNEAGTYALSRSQLVLDKIREAVAEPDHAEVGYIQVENLPISNFNGLATCAPNGDRIVIIDIYLKLILMIICQDLFALVMLRNNNQLNPDSAVIRLQHILHSKKIIVSNPEGIHAPGYLNIRNTDNVLVENEANILSECMMVFILSHEYAHHLLHIKNEPIDLILKFNGKEAIIKNYSRTQEHEFEADRLGFSFYMKCHNNQINFPVFAALNDYFFAPMLLFDIMSLEVKKNKINRNILTHPVPNDRKNRLQQTLPSSFGNDNARNLYIFFSQIFSVFTK